MKKEVEQKEPSVWYGYVLLDSQDNDGGEKRSGDEEGKVLHMRNGGS